MTAAHVHLILNHVPMLGVVFAAGLFLVARLLRSEQFQRVALWSLEEAVEDLPGVSEAVIDLHEDTAETAFVAAEVLGVVALGGALVFHRRPRIPMAFAVGVVALSLVTTALFGYTSYLGGQIRRPELRTGATPAAPVEADREAEERGRD